jgi:AcrR family transcriptional regulator
MRRAEDFRTRVPEQSRKSTMAPGKPRKAIRKKRSPARRPPAATLQDRGAETRARLIDAALDVFNEFGFDGASTRRIAEAAGANLAAIVYHFGSKEALHVAVARHVADSIAANISPVFSIAATGDPLASPDAARQAVLRMLDTFIDVILGKAEAARWARFIVREQMHPTAAFEVLYEFISGASAMASTVVAAALGQPESPETRLHVFALMGEVLYFRVAQPVVLRRMEWTAIDDAERAAIKRVVLSHVNAVLLAEQNR